MNIGKMENNIGEINEYRILLMSKNKIDVMIKRSLVEVVLARLLNILVFTHTDIKFENM